MEEFIKPIMSALISQQGAVGMFMLAAIVGLVWFIKSQRLEIKDIHASCKIERKELWDQMTQASEKHTEALQRLSMVIEALKGRMK